VTAGLAKAVRAGGWAVLAFGESAAAAAAEAAAGRARVTGLVYRDGGARTAYGLARGEDGLFLVRPDGHVGFAGRLADAGAAARYLADVLG
jgi:hypothetical protein